MLRWSQEPIKPPRVDIGDLWGGARRKMRVAVALSLLVALGFSDAAMAGRAPPLTLETINGAQWSPRIIESKLNPVVLKAQVLLDRAGFSPGVIDAHGGENFRKALKAFQQANDLPPSGDLDEATWQKLAGTSTEPVVTEYVIGEPDLKGPFVKRVPKDFEKMAELDRLAYRGPRELIAEKFHMSEELLATLNKAKKFERAQTSLLVANVPRLDTKGAAKTGRSQNDTNTGSAPPAAEKKQANGVRVEVNKTERSVRVFANEGGRLIAYYPASVGSTEKPAPSGKLEVRAVVRNPPYQYNPAYGFKGQKATEPVEIAPGPNSPVGLVWISLSAESYGIHGTPEPDKVSKSYSNGCVRLTNWDALALATLVKKGTPVEFVD